MPDYAFFFSYASADRITPAPDALVTDKNDYLRIFLDDLNQEVQPRYPDGGFFDKKEFRGLWRQELGDGLAASRVLLPLYSKNYFASRHCAKEWEVFRLRSEANRPGGPDGTPNVILPVIWDMPPGIPDGVTTYQYMTNDDYPVEYKQNGLYYLMKFKRYDDAYKKFVYLLGRQLLTLADEQGPEQIREVPPFDDIFPPFPKKRCRGLKQHYYIFVAGLKPHMANRKVDCYGRHSDRADWRPCFPNVEKLAKQLVESASNADTLVQLPPGGPKSPADVLNELRETQNRNQSFRMVEILTPPIGEKATNDLLDQLREAQRRNNVLFLLVDPWSLELPDFKYLIDALQSEAFPNAGVLLNWNSNDPETQLKPDVLEAAKAKLKRYVQLPVSSEPDLVKGVQALIDAIRARLTELGAIASADLDAGGAAPAIGTKPNG